MTAAHVVSNRELLAALAAVLALNLLFLTIIALAKLQRERMERISARVRDGLIETLLPQLEGGGEPVRLPAPHTLQGAAALETILGLIITLKGEARELLVRTLEQAGYVGYLVRRSRSASAARRARYAALLGGTHSIRAVPRLTALLARDESPEVRIVAAEALGAIGHLPSMHALFEAARNPTRFQELRIANVLADLGDAALPALQSFLTEGDTRLTALALDILIDIGSVKDARPVVELLADRSPEVRARAAALLGTAGIVEAIPALVFASRDPMWFVRLRIVKALAAIGVPDDADERAAYFGALQHLLFDDAWHVRRQAAAALAAAGSEGCAILASAGTQAARAALQFRDIHRGRHLSTVL